MSVPVPAPRLRPTARRFSPDPRRRSPSLPPSCGRTGGRILPPLRIFRRRRRRRRLLPQILPSLAILAFANPLPLFPPLPPLSVFPLVIGVFCACRPSAAANEAVFASSQIPPLPAIVSLPFLRQLQRFQVIFSISFFVIKAPANVFEISILFILPLCS